MSKDEVAEFAISLPSLFNETKSEERIIKSIFPITDVYSFKMEESLTGEEKDLLSLMYIVNYENDRGFAIICADNRSEQILAFSDRGNLDFTRENTKSGIYSNDGNYTIYDIIDLLPYYVQELSRYIINFPEIVSDLDSLDANGYYYANPSYYYSDWIDIEEEILFSAQWGQNSPYNYYCPIGGFDYDTGSVLNCVVGCNAVAIGEVMCHYAYPASLSVHYNGSNGTIVSIPWQNSYSTIDNDSKVIADLLRQIADQLPTDYGLEESTALFLNVPSTLAAFNYSCNSIQSYTFERVVQGISSFETPIIIYGRNSSSSYAHTWVIDGYKQSVKYKLCDWDVYGPDGLYKGRWTSIDSQGTIGSSYVHCNWGWNGDYNGYYSTLLFAPNSINLSYNRHIITNIKPANQ